MYNLLFYAHKNSRLHLLLTANKGYVRWSEEHISAQLKLELYRQDTLGGLPLRVRRPGPARTGFSSTSASRWRRIVAASRPRHALSKSLEHCGRGSEDSASPGSFHGERPRETLICETSCGFRVTTCDAKS